MSKSILAATSLAAGLALSAAPALADWTLSADDSRLAFGSIKKDTAGEVHHFPGISGSVTEAGAAMVEIDLTSVETWIDIRNERMREHLFDTATFPKATISAQFDPEELQLAPGETTTVSAEATLGFLGQEIDVEAELFVAALGEGKVMVTTDEMLMLGTSDLGIDQGVDALQEIAKLPSITRATPVTLRLIFVKD